MIKTGRRTALLMAASLGGTRSLAQPAVKTAAKAIRLGLLLDMSGPYADLTGPGSVTATKMAIEDFGGTVLGRPIEVVSVDTITKADVASAQAQAWFGTGEVDAIIDVVGSSAALAVQQIGRRANKVVILSSPGLTQLVNDYCSPTSMLYTYTSYGIAQTLGKATVEQGGKSWYFVAADYAFGASLVNDTSAVVKAAGGTILGDAKVPFGNDEFSAPLILAQSSGADVIALANSGSDMINAVKQAHEFRIGEGKQRLVALSVFITDIHALGLQMAQGMVLSESFYWALNDATRAWSKRFFARTKRMPTMLQAGVYSSTTHYLQAVQAADTDATDAVMAKMRAMPVKDFFASNGRIRPDGLMAHDMYMFQVKTPEESSGPWDYYRLLATVPADQVSPPLAASTCPLVKT